MLTNTFSLHSLTTTNKTLSLDSYDIYLLSNIGRPNDSLNDLLNDTLYLIKRGIIISTYIIDNNTGEILYSFKNGSPIPTDTL